MFKELFTESQEQDAQEIKILKLIIKNKHYAKNAVVFDKTLYLEFKDLKGVLRVQKKHGEYLVGYGGIREVGSGAIDYFKSYIKAILGSPNAVAEMAIHFHDTVPEEIKALTNASELSTSEYQKRIKKQREGQ